MAPRSRDPRDPALDEIQQAGIRKVIPLPSSRAIDFFKITNIYFEADGDKPGITIESAILGADTKTAEQIMDPPSSPGIRMQDHERALRSETHGEEPVRPHGLQEISSKAKLPSKRRESDSSSDRDFDAGNLNEIIPISSTGESYTCIPQEFKATGRERTRASIQEAASGKLRQDSRKRHKLRSAMR